MSLLSELTPLAQSLLSHLGGVPGEIVADVDVAQLELAIGEGLASGGGLVGVLDAVIVQSGTIFGAGKGAHAATLLASTKELLGHQVTTPALRRP
jgi:hypothetical protein